MKTLLSLTSRRFAMTRVRVLFNGPNEYGKAETQNDGIGIIQTTTRGRLVGLLGDVRGRLGMVAGAVALTLSASAYGSDSQEEITHDAGASGPVVVAIAQRNDSRPAGNYNVITPDNGSNEILAVNDGKKLENKDKVRIQPDLLVTILSKPNPPKTTEALEVLINLPTEHQAILVGETQVGDLATNYLFKLSNDLYIAVNDPKKGKPLPSLKETLEYLRGQQSLKGIALAKKLAILLDDSSITQENLDIDRDDAIDKLPDDVGLAISEELAAYAKEGKAYSAGEKALAKAGLATAKAGLATAKEGLATETNQLAVAKALAELFKQVKL